MSCALMQVYPTICEMSTINEMLVQGIAYGKFSAVAIAIIIIITYDTSWKLDKKGTNQMK